MICIDYDPSHPNTPFHVRIFGTDETITRVDAEALNELVATVAREAMEARAAQIRARAAPRRALEIND